MVFTFVSRYNQGIKDKRNRIIYDQPIAVFSDKSRRYYVESIAIHNNDIVECDSKKNLKIVDLTGAGDLFAAGFLHGYINKLSIKESLEKGTEMSSKIIQKIGARLK